MTVHVAVIDNTCLSRENERNRSKFAEWVANMVMGSVGKAHSWSKEEDQTGGMAVVWDEKLQEFNTDPNEVLDERTHDWASIWQCGSKGTIVRTNNAIKAAIKRATAEGRKGALITSRKC